MSTLKKQKLNQLMNNWLHGTVNTMTEFTKKGYNKDLIKKYKQSKWIESISTGAYKLFNDTIEWYGIINAIQSQLEMTIHPGGKTALMLKGYSHYIMAELKEIYLFGQQNEILPQWVKNTEFIKTFRYKRTKLFQNDNKTGLIEYVENQISIIISSPERAMLEMLYLVPKYHTTNESILIMEGLTTLRSDILQDLLEKCNSVKAKRLFLYIAEKFKYFWLKNLDIDKINLGSGKRAIDKKGKLDKKYLIVVNDGK